MRFRLVTSALILVQFFTTLSSAQPVGTTSNPYGVSTEYFESYPKLLSARIYSVSKFNSLRYSNGDQSSRVHFRPNVNYNVGIGATYQGFGLNIGLNLPFINNDDELYGETVVASDDAKK